MPRSAPAITYQVELADLHAHLFRVTMRLSAPQAQQQVSLPVWIPGSYLVREFARHLQQLQARQARRAVAIQQLDKCTWQLDCAPGVPLEISYEIYAFDNSVRTAWLDTQRAFFNGTSLFLRAHGHEEAPHTLTLLSRHSPRTWSVATGLPPIKTERRGFGQYQAGNYDELVDCPVLMGDFWRGDFVAHGVPHRLVVTGAPASLDGARLLRDCQTICETALRFWHPSLTPKGKGARAPFANYLFMLDATHDGYGGLEHRNSTALICTRKDLPRVDAPSKLSEGYVTLLGLISHEYFHTWNVKRLRPQEFARYDYTQENYTRLLWFFEGFTSYYDDLLLRRSGLLDDATYLKLLNKTINQVLQTPGRTVQSVAQASLDAWIKYYRQDENTPNATVSYYNKGALVALCLDLTLRQAGTHTLDDVMRALWLRCEGGPMQEDDLLAVLHELGGRSYAAELTRWVHSTDELPVRELLEATGVSVHDDPAQLAQTLGLRVDDSAGLRIKTVLRAGAAEQAGFAAGDEWLGIEVGQGTQRSAWRMTRMDDLALYAGAHTDVRALVARDQRLLHLTLKLPAPDRTWRLAVGAAEKLQRWLNA